MKTKKIGLFYFRNRIFHIKGDDGEAFDVDIYILHPEAGKTRKISQKMTYGRWANTHPFSASIELDRDSMQGLILGIFGETA